MGSFRFSAAACHLSQFQGQADSTAGRNREKWGFLQRLRIAASATGLFCLACYWSQSFWHIKGNRLRLRFLSAALTGDFSLLRGHADLCQRSNATNIAPLAPSLLVPLVPCKWMCCRACSYQNILERPADGHGRAAWACFGHFCQILPQAMACAGNPRGPSPASVIHRRP